MVLEHIPLWVRMLAFAAIMVLAGRLARPPWPWRVIVGASGFVALIGLLWNPLHHLGQRWGLVALAAVLVGWVAIVRYGLSAMASRRKQ